MKINKGNTLFVVYHAEKQRLFAIFLQSCTPQQNKEKKITTNVRTNKT